jgi:hypothetical protein
MNSLKRKKQSTTLTSKATGKKVKTLSFKSSNPSPPSSQSPNVSASPSKSLDHLLDRPYVEYDPQRDDIGIYTSSVYLNYSSPSVGM